MCHWLNQEALTTNSSSLLISQTGWNHWRGSLLELAWGGFCKKSITLKQPALMSLVGVTVDSLTGTIKATFQ